MVAMTVKAPVFPTVFSVPVYLDDLGLWENGSNPRIQRHR
jgi:hypothetical protein